MYRGLKRDVRREKRGHKTEKLKRTGPRGRGVKFSSYQKMDPKEMDEVPDFEKRSVILSYYPSKWSKQRVESPWLETGSNGLCHTVHCDKVDETDLKSTKSTVSYKSIIPFRSYNKIETVFVFRFRKNGEMTLRYHIKITLNHIKLFDSS